MGDGCRAGVFEGVEAVRLVELSGEGIEVTVGRPACRLLDGGDIAGLAGHCTLRHFGG